MAVSYVWPGTLPQNVAQNYAETGGALILRTPMDAGPAKLRRRGMRPQTLQVSLDMTTAQVAIMETFILDTLRGTSRFGFPHPRLQSEAEVRLVPSSDGQLYGITYKSPNCWTVALALEILP
jgi:hypothetical protein